VRRGLEAILDAVVALANIVTRYHEPPDKPPDDTKKPPA